jgi:hypothetical protein
MWTHLSVMFTPRRNDLFIILDNSFKNKAVFYVGAVTILHQVQFLQHEKHFDLR